MENATKALIITAGVLIGVMILSLGVYMYSNLGEYISTTQEEMENNATNRFNTQFFKYMNIMGNGQPDPNNVLTIQDVVTVANLARQNNEQHGVTVNDAGGNTYYVTVNATIHGNMINNLEIYTNDEIAELLRRGC